jgi:hypothetical protein
MFLQKIAIFGVLAIIMATLVSTLLITNFTLNAKSLPLQPATTAVAETLSNSTNSTSQIIPHPENLTSGHLAPQTKGLLEQAQNNRLKGPPLPSSSEPIHGPAPGTASP